MRMQSRKRRRNETTEWTIVDVVKLRDYCLSAQHSYGRNKARVFRSSLGFDASRADELRQILLDVAAKEEAEAKKLDEHGQRYVIEFSLPGRSGSVVRLRGCWIVLVDEEVPRLTSCYVVTSKREKP
jgi:hypothetical protein